MSSTIDEEILEVLSDFDDMMGGVVRDFNRRVDTVPKNSSLSLVNLILGSSDYTQGIAPIFSDNHLRSNIKLLDRGVIDEVLLENIKSDLLDLGLAVLDLAIEGFKII
jgi:hypothetical protein